MFFLFNPLMEVWGRVFGKMLYEGNIIFESGNSTCWKTIFKQCMLKFMSEMNEVAKKMLA